MTVIGVQMPDKKPNFLDIAMDLWGGKMPFDARISDIEAALQAAYELGISNAMAGVASCGPDEASIGAAYEQGVSHAMAAAVSYGGHDEKNLRREMKLLLWPKSP